MTMRELIVATTNPGKVREIRAVLGESVRVLTLAEAGVSVAEPEETGHSFHENARLKAAYYAAITGQLTVAEDSGLAIDALGGRPGIHSARYPGATYPEKFANLYAELAPFPRPWTARYVCALSLMSGAAPLFECEGTVEGEIAPEPAGTQGFGYDPIFRYPPFDATFGEVDDARKLTVAHRGAAFRKLKAFLESPARS
jgi:XTP/dITP diphosphohydrolase